MPSISATGVKFRIARDAHLTAVGAAEMEGSIRAIWKRLEPLLNPKTKTRCLAWCPSPWSRPGRRVTVPTKWSNQLSRSQLDLLLMVANRPEQASGFKLVLGNRCHEGILNPYVREMRTVKALLDRGLVRWVYCGPGIKYSGITLTQAGADTLSPPATVTYPEHAV